MYHKRWAPAGAAVAALSVLAGLALAAPAAAAAGWTAVTVPLTGNNTELNAVSARTSADAWAVGVQFGAAGQAPPPPVAYHWNGSAWSLTATPSPGVNAGLNAVSASSASDAWAVGFTLPSGYRVRQPLYEHWNGSAWSTVSGPGLGLNGVADLSPGSAWAVTILPQPAVSGPSSPILHGVTAVAVDNVWAVGENEEVPGLGITTLIEHWNGSAWSIVPSPTPGAYPTLNAVAARSASDVYAVGFNEPSVNGGVQQGLILRWNGSAWSADTDPTAGTFSPLYGAATLPGATGEWAAGINAADQALVLRHG